MSKFIERVKVLAKAVPTWLSGAAVAIAVAAPEIAKLLPHQAENITKFATQAAAWIAAATLIVRRVTPVDQEDRGLLVPPEKG